MTGLIRLTECYFTEYKSYGISGKGIGVFNSYKLMAHRGHLLAKIKEIACENEIHLPG